VKSYGYDTGLLKNDDLLHTHVNPLIDQVQASSKEEEQLYPETFRKHSWPQLQGFEDITKDLFEVIQNMTLTFARHLDEHVKKTLSHEHANY